MDMSKMIARGVSHVKNEAEEVVDLLSQNELKAIESCKKLVQ